MDKYHSFVKEIIYQNIPCDDFIGHCVRDESLFNEFMLCEMSLYMLYFPESQAQL